MSAICDAHRKVAVELLYNSVKTGSQLVCRPDQLEKDAGMRTCPREAGSPGHRLSSPGERERNEDDNQSGGQYVAVLFSLTHNPFRKVRGIFF